MVSYPVVAATMFHLFVMMDLMQFLINQRAAKDEEMPQQYKRFMIALQCEVLAVLGNIGIKMIFLMFRTCFRFNRNDHSYLALFNIVSGNPVSKKRVGHDNIDAESDLLWYVIKVSKICDASAVPMIIYIYLTIVGFRGPSENVALMIIAYWLLPA